MGCDQALNAGPSVASMARVLGDRYELGGRIGVGGTAEVFEARDRRLDRRVAIKLLRIDFADASARARFEHEARAAASLSHPNVVRIYDVGEDGSRPYLVMELVEGHSVAELLDERGRLEPALVVVIVEQILGALAEAHAAGWVHRDVKPSNILLAADGVAKLADFGIAKAVSDATQGMTAAGQLIGTAKYLSPEQVSGDAATARSDLYALGVVLYEMLAGEPPFVADTPIAIALAHQRAPVPPLAARRPGLAPSLVAVVERALQKDPDRRFVDAESMRHALSAASDASIAPLIASTAVLPADSAAATAVVPLADPTDVIAAHEPSPIPLVSTDQSQTPNRASRRALGVAVAILAFVAVLVVARRNAQDWNGVLPSTTIPAPATTAVPTTAKVSTTTAPLTIDALIARIAANPAAAGEKGDELLKKLREIQRENSQKPGGKSVQETARKTADEINEWVDEGELDPSIAAVAQQVLQTLAR